MSCDPEKRDKQERELVEKVIARQRAREAQEEFDKLQHNEQVFKELAQEEHDYATHYVDVRHAYKKNQEALKRERAKQP